MQNNSLYMQIIKAENNAAVIRDVIVAGMNPFLCRIIKALVFKDFSKWAYERIFIEDFEEYKKHPDSSYLSTNIFTFYKLISNLKNPPKSIERLSDKDLKYLTYNNVKKELLATKIEFIEPSLNKIDTAGYIKLIRGRINYDFDKQKILWKPLDNILELRNEFEGHLTEEAKLECSVNVVKAKANSLIADLHSAADTLESLNDNVMQNCRQALKDAEKYLRQVLKTVEDIEGCEILKDSSQRYKATNLFKYTIFMVYPNMKSDKFRRFCNDELRIQHTLKGKTLYTDIGTVSYLEAYATSKNEDIKDEAKRLIKELFKPLNSLGILKVIKPDDTNESDDYISMSEITPKEQFMDMLEQIDGNICVITDDLEIAKKVWSLNANKDMKSFSAVAVKVYNTSSVVPFYE